MTVRHAFQAALAVSLLSAALPDFAAETAPAVPPAGSVVTAVQSPAWLVHGTSITPIRPGLIVADGDTLRTAGGGRVYVQLPEHSMVKLGENTEFMTPTMQMTKDDKGSLFNGVLHVLKGVFRFTTSLVGKSERRHVDIQVGVATIGIRGTDVWGRASADGSLVALLEGKAQMDMPGHATMMMEQPMHYNMMPANGQMQMNLPVTQDNVSDWAAQTDVKQGAGVLADDGQYTVALISSTSQRDTDRLMQNLATAGYPAEDTLVTIKGQQWHRLVITHASTLQDAKAISTAIGKQFPLMSPWFYRQK